VLSSSMAICLFLLVAFVERKVIRYA